MPPVYRRPEDEGWAELSIALAKSTAEAGIITVNDDDKDDDGEDDDEDSSEDSDDTLDWSAFDYYSGRS
jgi:hypothetical protein